MSPDIVREINYPSIIRVITPPEREVIKVVEQGPQGAVGPRIITNSFTRQGPIVVPFTGTGYWYLQNGGALEAFTAYVNLTPTASPLRVWLTLNDVQFAQALIPIGQRFGVNTVNLGNTIPPNTALGIVIAGDTSTTGADTLTATVSVRG